MLKDFQTHYPTGQPNGRHCSFFSSIFVVELLWSLVLRTSYGGIMRTDEANQVQPMKRRGWRGSRPLALSTKGSLVMNSALSSTGIVPFINSYSNSTREVAQDGRRGALMLSISIKHPGCRGLYRC
ncbi:MAG: hypothetical protein IPJ74_25200 [Saprospiraceae bacterium]|nr:hypothetical protein [Saprospiraceae bacterium]